MADQFLAEIRVFPFNFAPAGWAFCNGQLMPISQNTALFSLLGTTYGGDGKSTFALPNLQGQAPLQHGQGPGLSDRFLGESSGSSTVTLLQSEMPVHSHTLRGDLVDPADTSTPNPNASYGLSAGGTLYQASSNAQLDPAALVPAGGSLPHNNMQPYLTLHFCIALQGIFPARP
ncbi:phage tail protein [Nocardioides daeguensis]|uniref:Tail fiber protein n=1 Tax=Nocardioides daeguensis TaxID=908359 RepID=A0ABP6VM75_9ACTN|nr:tail fiber protein [Nocardioides daeguensis]MBV6727454.1 tail fiber protein [Nocardioides daeguensis]MCR1773324.1 tail fiber protein [Nocardioides daeguensis]